MPTFCRALGASFFAFPPSVVPKSAPGTAFCHEIGDLGLKAPQLGQRFRINRLRFFDFAILDLHPNARRPEDVSAAWEARLNLVYGGDSWKDLYKEGRQRNLLGEIERERDPSVDGLVKIYMKNLTKLFGKRHLNKSKTFKNSKNSPLFEFLFCVGHPNGVKIATGIAAHLLDHD